MPKFYPPFAWNGERRSTTSDEQEYGIPCGPFDRKMWNQLFRNTQAELGNLITLSGQEDSESDLLQVAKAIQSGKLNYAIATGTASALIAEFTPEIKSYSPGMVLNIVTSFGNTGAITLNAGAGSLPVVRHDGSQLIAGDIIADMIQAFKLNKTGTAWQIYPAAKQSSLISYRSPGTYSFTVPVGVVELNVTAWGAGGGGGGCAQNAGASGAGGGGYGRKKIKVTPGQFITIIVGAGGDGGSAGGGGGRNGGSTSVGSYLTCTGGGGGNGAGAGYQPASGIAGTSIGGDIGISGSHGGTAITSGSVYVGGMGGAAPAGGGPTPLAGDTPWDGYFPGGGASAGGGGNRAMYGGKGASGCVIIEY